MVHRKSTVVCPQILRSLILSGLFKLEPSMDLGAETFCFLLFLRKKKEIVRPTIEELLRVKTMVFYEKPLRFHELMEDRHPQAKISPYFAR